MGGVIALVILIIFLMIVFVKTIRIVPQRVAFIIERLGKYHGTLDAGFHILVPFIDKVAYKHNLKEQAVDVPPQTCITRDNIAVEGDGILYLQVIDPMKASYGIADYLFAATQLAQTTMRSEVGKIERGMTVEECAAAGPAAFASAPVDRTGEHGQTAPCSKKVIICLKNGGLLKGTVSAVSLDSEGIAYVPSMRREAAQKIVPFADIVVVHFVDEFEEEISHGRPAENSQPRGREIFAALLNGDMIHGIFLHSQSPANPRFYVISSNNQRQHWALIEKTGTVGILCERVQEGIYAEEFETLSSDGLTSIADSHLVSPPELSADKFFSLQQYAAASIEYQEALKLFPDSKRVEMKLSLCRLNLGIQRQIGRAHV